MTSKPYTYTKLIQGHTCARNDSQKTISDLLARKNLTSEQVTLLNWHKKLVDYLQDEIRRCSLLRLVCGDVCVIYSTKGEIE